MARFRTGLIGCGRIGSFTTPETLRSLRQSFFPYNHAEAIRSVPELELVALCDSNSENLNRAATTFDVSQTFASYSDCLKESALDVVSIATRTPHKQEILEACLSFGVRGIHVEKPLTNSFESTVYLLDAIKKTGVALTYGTTRRFMDGYRLAKSKLNEGTIGDLVEINVEFGSGLLLWTLPHRVDLIQFFNANSMVDTVRADSDPIFEVSKNLVVQDPMIHSALIRFENGVQARMLSTTGNTTTLIGTKGHIRICDDASVIRIETKNSLQEIVPPITMSGTQRAFSELAIYLASGVLTSITLNEIQENQRILFLLGLSAVLGGREVKVHDLPHDFTIVGETSGNPA